MIGDRRRVRCMAEPASRPGGQELPRTAVDVSVVIPSYGSGPALQQCLASVLGQRFAGSFEVIVFTSADTDQHLPELPDDPRLRRLTEVPRVAAAVARNRAVAEAQGNAIAFTDADVVVAEDWLQRLAAASGGVRCVAGAVVNGTPHSAVGTAEYLLQFVDLHPRRRPAAVHFGATCNLYLPFELWAAEGPFPEGMDGGEDTLITAGLRSKGLFVFEPTARVTHVNRTRFNDFIQHQYEFGRFSARLARLGPDLAGTPLRRRLQCHPALAPIAVAGKLGWVMYRAVGCDRALGRTALRCLPVLVTGVVAWGAGLMLEGIRCGRAGRRPQRNSHRTAS